MTETINSEARGGSVSRRDFAVAAGAAVSVASVATPALAQQAVTETDVNIKTADGVCDAVVFHPTKAGKYPAAIIIPDALGLRPAFRDIGRKLAAEGYTVLVPNVFYRTRKAPVLDGAFDFANPADRAKLTDLRAPMTIAATTRDSDAYIDFMDAHPRVNKAAKIGVSGHCMGGALAMRAAASKPDRVGATVSFHGGGLVTKDADSPHLLVPKIKAKGYFGIADPDDKADPEAKVGLKAAYDAVGRPAKIEVYQGALHGWTVEGAAYNQAAAERAYGEQLALYKTALV